MDHEYIQHIQGSPYVKEGMWDRFKAKAAQQMGSLGAMAGHQIQDPNEAKIRSLWDGFMKSLKSIMKDWDSQVAPMFDEQVPLDQNGETIKAAIDSLSRSLRPEYPTTIGKVHPDPNHPPLRSPYAEPNERGSKYAHPINLKTLAPKKQQQNYDIEEGFWDAANRDLKLNKALGSNDPTQILNAYKKYILNLFNGFMKDAMKVTGLQASQIYQTLAKMKATSHMQRVVQALKQLQSSGEANPQAEPGEVPPVQPSGAQPPPIPQQPPPIPKQPEPYSGPVPPKIGPDGKPLPPEEPQSPEQPAAEEPPDHLPKDPTQKQNAAPKEEFQFTSQEVPFIILKAMRIIIDAVSSDKSHVGQYFTAPQMPTDYSPETDISEIARKILKEIHADPKSNQPKPSVDQMETDKFEPIPKEFVYNFHGYYRKHPNTQFPIEVEPVNEDPNVKEIPGLSVKVWWVCEGPKNKIYAYGYKDGKESPPLLVMSFNDHQVSSKVGAATPGDYNEFSVKKIVNQNDPTGADKLAAATPQVMEQINKLQNLLLRSLMVVTKRKAKEFKAKAKHVIPITYDKLGNISYIDPETKVSKTMTKDEVQKVLQGEYEQSKIWKDTLEHYDYFKKFNVQYIEPDQYPAWKEAEHELVTAKGQSESGARKLLVKAWMELSKTKPQDQISKQDLLSHAGHGGPEPTSEPEPESEPEPTFDDFIQKYPALNDAYLAVVKLNGNKQKAKEQVNAAWEQLTKTKKPEDITTQEIIALATKPPSTEPPKSEPPAPPESPKTPPTGPSAPAGGAAPTAPVSGPASGPAPSTEPTAPVSDKGKEDAKAAEKPTEKPSGETEKPEKTFWLDDDGSIMMMGKSGQHPVSLAQANALVKKNPKIGDKFKADGIDLDKMNADAQSKAKEKPAQKKPKKKLKEGIDGIVNPYDPANFL